MNNQGMSLRKLATVLGVSQPFLSQIRAGKRPLPEALRRKVEALDAYHLLIGDKHISGYPGDEGAGHTEKVASSGTERVVEVRGIEPLTPCVQSRCSPAELHPHNAVSVGFGARGCQRKLTIVRQQSCRRV